MGIEKNRVFDTDQIKVLIRKTQDLMDMADTITHEIYSELCRLSATLSKIPPEVRDMGLQQRVESLKGSILTDEFRNYRSYITNSLNRLTDNISREDKKQGTSLDVIVVSVKNMTNRLKDLTSLIPEGADNGNFKDFEKAFQECTRNWDSIGDRLNQLLAQIAAALKGGNNESVCLSDDPVNLSTGNFIYKKIDLKLDGTPQLAMTRFYNELDKQEGSMGRGWYHPYEVRLLIQEDAYTVLLEDGKEEHFQKKKDGSFFGETTTSRLLTEGEGYRYHTRQGENYYFNNEGQYTAWEDRAGNRLKFSYEKDCLKQVLREQDGAYFTFAYDKEGRVVQVGDHGGRSAAYTYDEEGRLHTARNAEGAEYRYDYDEDGRIMSVTNPEGTITVENHYDSQGRTVLQKFPDGGSMSYEYRDEEKQVILTERNGSRITYCHDERYHNVRTIYEDGEEQFAYNRKGQRIRYRDCNGNTTRYAYDSRGNLTQVIDALGVKSNATYDENNQLLKLTVNGVEQLKNTYDSQGNLIESRDALGRITAFAYQEKRKLSRITRADGSNIYFSYDEKGNVIGITDSYGNTTTYEYDNLQRIILVTDPKGGKISYTYDSMDRITSVVSPSGAVTRYCYNQSGKRTEVQRPDGEVLKTEYNILNHPSSIIDAMGNRILLRYDAMWNVSGIKTEGGAEENYQYDMRNRLSKVTNALGGTIEYGYDGNGNKIWEKRPEGEISRFIYDAANRLKEQIDPEGNRTSYQYDERGNLIAVTDAMGNESRIVYDAAGQKISETDVLGNTTSYTYTALGKIETITDAAGRVTRYEYQDGGRVNKVYYPNGTWESYKYDVVGNITEKVNSAGIVIHCIYDIENRLIARSVQNGPEEKYQYDIMGNLISVTDAAGNETKYAYDKNGNMIGVEDALGNKTEYVYDKSNQLIKILKEGKVETGYDRNILGQVEKVWDALGEKETFCYDKNGRKIEKQNRDRYQTFYEYDKNGRLKEIQYADGRKTSYIYNPLGHLEQVKDWLGTTKVENNALGQVLNIIGPDGKTVSYSYGKNGERTSMTYPDGKTVYYGYDEALRLTSLKDGEQVLTYGYDENSRLAEKILPNGIKTSYQYTPLGQLEEMTSSGSEGILEHFTYGYDVLGNRIWEEKERAGLQKESGNYTYKYDPMGRLLEVRKELKLLRSYQYDAMGNRTQKISEKADGTRKINYQYNEIGQLIQESSDESTREYYYDGRGNLTQILKNGIEQYHYQYGVLNRLEEAWNANGKTAKYSYNGLGFRTGRTEEERQISYVLDMTREYNNLLFCQEEENTTHFLWDNSVALMEREGNISSFLTDQQGSTLRLLNENGVVEESYGYDEFGNDLYENSGITQPFGYTGYETDTISGTRFAQAREYQPAVGRFISEDSIKGFAAQPITLNHYAYCFNNPLMLVDRNGAWPSLSDIGEGIGDLWHAVTDAADSFANGVKDVASNVSDWVGEHKEDIIKVVGTTAAIAGAVAITTVTMGTASGLIVAGFAAGGAICGGVESSQNGGSIIDGATRGGILGTIMGISTVVNPSGTFAGGLAQGINDLLVGEPSSMEAYAASMMAGAIAGNIYEGLPAAMRIGEAVPGMQALRAVGIRSGVAGLGGMLACGMGDIFENINGRGQNSVLKIATDVIAGGLTAAVTNAFGQTVIPYDRYFWLHSSTSQAAADTLETGISGAFLGLYNSIRKILTERNKNDDNKK